MSNDTLDQPLPKKNEINTQPVAIKFGIIASLIAIIASILLFVADVEYNGLWKWLPTILILAIILVAQNQIVKTNKPHLFSFGNLFKLGFTISLITAVMMLVYFVIYTNVIAPDFVDKILEVSRDEMVKKGLSDEQVEATLEMSKKFMSPVMMMVMGFIMNILLGAITSAIGAAIFKNEK